MVDLTSKFKKIIKTLPKQGMLSVEEGKKNESSQIDQIFNSFSSDLVFNINKLGALPILALFLDHKNKKFEKNYD